MIARRPAAVLLGKTRVDASPAWPGVPLPKLNPSFMAREGDILNNPVFKAAYEPATLPLGQGWYLHFYLRRDLEARAAKGGSN